MSEAEYLTITSLPKEIQTYILCNLDGLSIARAMKVCHLWRNIIKGFAKYSHIWLRCCLKEIKSYYLYELTNFREIIGSEESSSHFMETAKNLPSFFWHEIYSEYQRQRYIVSGKETQIKLQYPNSYGNVCSLAFKESCFFSGHEDGKVLCWICTEGTVQLPCICHQHKRMVTDIDVTSAGQSISHMLLGINNILVLSASQDTKMILNDIKDKRTTEINCYSKQVNAVSCDGRKIVAAASGCFLQGHPVWEIIYDNDLSAKCTQTNLLIGEETTNIVAVALQNDTIYTADDVGNLSVYVLKDTLRTDQNLATNRCIKKFEVPVKKLQAHENYLFCFLENGTLHVTQDKKNFKEYNLYSVFHRIPECFTLRGNILAVGTKGGKIYLYFLKNDTIDLETPTRTLFLEAEHINAMVLGDSGAGPFLVVGMDAAGIVMCQWSCLK